VSATNHGAPRADAVAQPGKGLGCMLGEEVGAILTGEHPPAMSAAPARRSPPLLLDLLREPVDHEQPERVRGQRDPARLACIRLGLALDHAGADLHKRRADDQVSLGVLRVLPAQAQRLTTAQARPCHELVERPEPMLSGNFHEGRELRRRPRVRLRRRRLGYLHLRCRIERDQPRLTRPGERRSEYGVNALDRDGTLAGLAQVRDHPLDVLRSQVAQPDSPKVRDEHRVHIRSIPQSRGGPEAVLDPPIKPRRQPLTNRESPVVPVLTCGHRGDHLSERRLRFLGRPEAVFPLFPPLPGERVRANVNGSARGVRSDEEVPLPPHTLGLHPTNTDGLQP
jgi:hypothetical protein